MRGKCSVDLNGRCHNTFSDASATEVSATEVSGTVSAVSQGSTMIQYMGTKKTAEGGTLYVFLINGLQREIRESALKQHPGCYEALPSQVKAKIAANRQWMSKL